MTYVIYKSTTRGPDGEPKKKDGLEDDEQQPGRFGGRGGAGGGGPSLLTRSRRSGAASSASRRRVMCTSPARTGLVAATASSPGPTSTRSTSRPARRRASSKGKGDMLETIDAVDGDDVKPRLHHAAEAGRRARFVHDRAGQRQGHQADQQRRSRRRGSTTLKIERFQVTRVDGFKFWVKVTTLAEGDRQAAGAVLDLSARVRRPGGVQRRRAARWRRSGGDWRAGSRSPARGRWRSSRCSATPSSSRTFRSSARPAG